MTTDERDLLLELAERLVSVPYPSFPVPMPRVQLLTGAAPDSLPVSLPQPPGTRLLGSVLRPQDTGLSVDIVLTTRATPETIVTFYDEQLTAQGWKQSAGTDPMSRSGFQSTLSVPVYHYSHSETGPSVSVTIMAPVDDEYEVRIHVEPAHAAQPSWQEPAGAHMLPQLAPPHGVLLRPGGGQSSNFGATSFASARTSLSAAALETDFEQQLAAAGWTRQDGGTNGALDWSSWSVPQTEGEPWEGMLFVVEEPQRTTRWLHLRTNAPGREELFTSWGGGSWTDMRIVRR